MCFPSSYQAVDLPISRNPVFFLNKLFLLFLFLDSCCIPPRNVSDSVQFLSLLFCQQNPSLIHSPVDDVLRRSVLIQSERFDLVEIFSQVSVKSTFTSRVTTTSLNRKLTFPSYVSPSRNPDQPLMRGFCLTSDLARGTRFRIHRRSDLSTLLLPPLSLYSNPTRTFTDAI